MYLHIPWILQEVAFRMTSGQLDPIKPLMFADNTWMAQLSGFNQFGAKSEQISQIALIFFRVMTCF